MLQSLTFNMTSVSTNRNDKVSSLLMNLSWLRSMKHDIDSRKRDWSPSRQQTGDFQLSKQLDQSRICTKLFMAYYNLDMSGISSRK